MEKLDVNYTAYQTKVLVQESAKQNMLLSFEWLHLRIFQILFHRRLNVKES